MLFECSLEAGCNWSTREPPKAVDPQLFEVRILQARETAQRILSDPDLYGEVPRRRHEIQAVETLLLDVIAEAVRSWGSPTGFLGSFARALSRFRPRDLEADAFYSFGTPRLSHLQVSHRKLSHAHLSA